MISGNSGIRKTDVINRRMFIIGAAKVIILDLVFLYQVDFMDYLINSGFTFLFYPLFFILFNILNSKISNKQND